MNLLQHLCSCLTPLSDSQQLGGEERRPGAEHSTVSKQFHPINRCCILCFAVPAYAAALVPNVPKASRHCRGTLQRPPVLCYRGVGVPATSKTRSLFPLRPLKPLIQHPHPYHHLCGSLCDTCLPSCAQQDISAFCVFAGPTLATSVCCAAHQTSTDITY